MLISRKLPLAAALLTIMSIGVPSVVSLQTGSNAVNETINDQINSNATVAREKVTGLAAMPGSATQTANTGVAGLAKSAVLAIDVSTVSARPMQPPARNMLYSVARAFGAGKSNNSTAASQDDWKEL